MIRLLSIICFLLIFLSCTNSSLKEKTLVKEIVNGKTISKIEVGRGDFLIVYKSNGKLDTIPIFAYVSYFKKIDTLTVLNKKRGSHLLHLHNLKLSDTSRFNDAIPLIYW